MHRIVPLSLVLSLAGLAVATPAAAQVDFRTCLNGLRQEVTARGISGPVFDAAVLGVQPDMKVIELMNDQPEFKTPIWDYMAGLVDDERIADGKAAMRQNAAALANAETRFGVDRYVIAAVWGVESNYGKAPGDRPLVQSLVTLACYGGKRGSYFKGELAATLKMIEQGDVNPARLTGSWAGAFGQTQFMPSTFLRLAVDGDGDGRRDVVDSVPDALASTANFLRKAGWVTGGTWGYEVLLPSNFNASLAGRGRKKPFTAWASMGIKRADGRSMIEEGTASLILPAGPTGPAFLVTKNFDAIYSYNAAESYALAIAHLSDRLRGGGPLRTPWPTDDPGLSRAQKRELQALLTRRGYDVGVPDGAIGAKTRAAIAAVQGRIGMEPNGRPSLKVLQAVQAGR